MTTILERRKQRRFKVKKGGAFVDLHKSHFFRLGKSKIVELGPVVNISVGGLSALYVNRKVRPAKSNLLSIRTSKDNVKIDDFLFQIVSDHETIILPGAGPVRKCGIKFDKLSENQISSLENFIQIYSLESLIQNHAL
jgi:hypothetical protein